MSAPTPTTDAGSASTEPAPSTPAAANSFETAIGAQIDAAFAAAKTPPPAARDTPPPADATAPDTGADDADAGDDGSLPGGEITPPPSKVAPPEPDSDDALKREIDDTTKGWEKKQREAFTKKTYAIRDLKRQLAELTPLKAELEAVRAKGDPTAAVQTQLTEALSKISDYEGRIAQVDIQQTGVWQQQVAAPLGEVNALITKLATKYSSDPVALGNALASSGDDRSDKIAAASSEMNEFDRQQFFQAAFKHEQISATAARLRENATGTIQQLTAAQQAEQARAEAAAKAEWDSAAPKAWDRVAKMAPVLAETEGADDWNSAIAKAKTFASTVKYGDLGVTEQAEVLHRAAAFPLVNSMVRALEKEVAALRENLGKYKVASPAAGGGTPAAAARAGAVAANASFEDAIAQKLREAGLA